jgi:hypothetical protein
MAGSIIAKIIGIPKSNCFEVACFDALIGQEDAVTMEFHNVMCVVGTWDDVDSLAVIYRYVACVIYFHESPEILTT